MLKHNLENNSNEHDEVELSRRGFFGRLAVGAVLSLAVPGVVNAAKSASVKADKNHRQAQTQKTAVRLPKHSAAKTKPHQAGKPSTAVTKRTHDKTAKGTAKLAANKHKSSHVEHAHLQTAHSGQSARVRDVYTGKTRHTVSAASEHHGSHHQAGRSQSIIQPLQREPLLTSTQQPMFLADHGRLANHRTLAFQNPHTGDKLTLTYFEKGRYLSDALEEINFLLRDHRTDDIHPIDPELLDQLHDLKQMLGLQQPFDVICGYRSPLTNARLHAEHSGVANNSFHMYGRAVDIRIERFDLRRIHNAAVAMHRGGVGYYPDSNFIHLDTGTFRTWSL